jgi:amino acid adenylation domain-containing protein
MAGDVEAECLAPSHEPARPPGSEQTPAGRLEEAFAAQAERAPDRPAVLHDGTILSYGALDAVSNRMAHRLQDMGVGPGVLVALCLPRTPRLIAAMLGILKAGGAYLPLDPTYPAERLAYMLSDSGADILLIEGALPDGLLFDGTLCDLKTEWPAIEAAPSSPVKHGGTAEDLAYVIYTSGSTGRPKGAMLAHSATGLIAWLASAFDPRDVARIAACTSICFDPSIIEIFGTLGIGSLIVLKRDALEPFAPGECPTLIAAPPSVLAELARMKAIPDSTRILNVGGETVTAGLIRLLFGSCAAREIHNHYGPTEATTCTTMAPILREDLDEPTIGKPIAGARIYLLDEEGVPVPPGTTGEIHIAGPTVAMGYVGTGQERIDRFLPDPFVPGDRMYRTGDLGRFRSDGDLEFKGRVDTQVKLRGFRIELGEVEAAIMRLQHVSQAAAIVQADDRGRDRLVAFVAAEAPVNMVAARRQLATWLPAHMLPAKIVTLPRLPLANTGKIDRAALGRLSLDAEPLVPSSRLYGSTIEGIVAGVFSRHLGHAEIGPDDDLYDFGGDSLLAIEVALELEDLLGKAISPAMLAHDATPRALALAVTSMPSTHGAVLNQIQPSGDRPPLFCTPDLYGRPLSYVSLARRLAPLQPLVGLSPGRHAEAFIGQPDVRMLSRAYLDAIRTMQPSGPYLISGYSFGATQAFDLACLIEEEGETAHLILIDGPIVRKAPSFGYVRRWLGRETGRTIADRGLRRTMRDINGSRHVWSRLLMGSRRRVRTNEVPRFVPKTDRTLARALMQSTVSYTPREYTGSSTMIRCTDPFPILDLHDEDGSLGWSGLLTGRMRAFRVEGSHTRMMQEPLVAEVQCIVQAAIAEFTAQPETA